MRRIIKNDYDEVFEKLQMLTDNGLDQFLENVTLNHLKNSLEDIFDDDDEDGEEQNRSDDDDDDENIEGGENDEENEDAGSEGG
uniref:Uncharacterized protein n=1 Tax=Lactuca sativa TaxID=4236 RepID=A0A9R1X567_LACSA|nr:hypothetical protein LSAT_V11C700355910 [Lactuca sativa]